MRTVSASYLRFSRKRAGRKILSASIIHGDKMDELEDFISKLSMLKNNGAKGFSAIATKTCKICKEKAIGFRDSVSEFEYSVSGICQTCQDKYIHGKTAPISDNFAS